MTIPLGGAGPCNLTQIAQGRMEYRSDSRKFTGAGCTGIILNRVNGRMLLGLMHRFSSTGSLLSKVDQDRTQTRLSWSLVPDTGSTSLHPDR